MIKKLLVIGLMVSLCLYFVVPGYAASIGNAETQGKGKLGVGIDYELICDRDMKHVKGTDLDWQKVEIARMYRAMGKISYGLLDNLDIYVKLGIADAKIKGKAYDPGLGSEGIYGAKTSNAFAWGVGAKTIYELVEDWLVGAEVQYLIHRHDTRVSYTGELDWDAKHIFREWQVAPYLAKRIDNFTPYIGVKYSDLRVKHKDDDSTVKFKANDNFGVFLGADYKFGDWKLNLEGRFVDESAMSVALTYRF